jgi:hypothetical protein
MLPSTYELPIAILLILGGAVACFAGYRLFRSVLGIYGFIVGAMMTSSVIGSANALAMVAGAIIGGIAGALVLVFAYFVGIAITGAGLGALVAHLAWRQATTVDPPAPAVIVASIGGSIGAMLLQRYVIVAATAFAGAWTMLVGVLAASGAKALPRGTAGADVWVLYPLTPAPGQTWAPIAWIVLGLAGTAVQLWLSSRKR